MRLEAEPDVIACLSMLRGILLSLEPVRKLSVRQGWFISQPSLGVTWERLRVNAPMQSKIKPGNVLIRTCGGEGCSGCLPS